MKKENNNEQKNEQAGSKGLRRTIGLISLLLIFSGLGITYSMTRPEITDIAGELFEPEENTLRLKMNTNIYISGHRLSNLEFCNMNAERYMRLKLRFEDQEEYFYVSPFIESGKKLHSDYYFGKTIPQGTQSVLAEIYSYDMDKQQLGQNNLIVTISN